MAETFGARLRRLRTAGGYSRRELAEGAGLSESAIRDYEQEQRSPSLEAALRLALALGKPLSVWDGIDGMTQGAYRLPPAPSAAGALAFGQHKGCLPSECPTDYLEWLARERPSQLTDTQLQTVQRLLRQRRRDRQAGEQEERAAAEGARQRDRSARYAMRQAEADARRADAEARQKQADARRAEAEAQAEETRRQRRAEELRPAAIKPQQAAKPRLDDTLPGEQPP